MATALFICSEDARPKKILFLGDGNIGKTAFIEKYSENLKEEFNIDTHKGSFLVFELFLFYQPLGLKLIPVQLLDLPAGTTRESRQDQYPSEVDGVVLCYAIDKPSSFSNVSEIWLRECRQYYSNTTPYYLLGLRKDLRDNEETRLELSKTKYEPITSERAFEIFRQFQFSGLTHMESSVKEDPKDSCKIMDILISELFSEEYDV